MLTQKRYERSNPQAFRHTGCISLEFEFELDALGRDAAREKADFPRQCQSRLIFSKDNAAQSLQATSRLKHARPSGRAGCRLLYSIVENGHRLQPDQELVRESGEAGIPGVYFVRPTVRLRRISCQRASRIDETEVIGRVAREVREHVMKQIDHADYDSIPSP
jgi:hypothetical protein